MARLRAPSLAALGIRQCTRCGCTEEYACEGGCHWIGPLLCSSCGPEVPAIADGQPVGSEADG
jgi:hypothetical protein